MVDFGQRLRALRCKESLSQTQLAKRLALTQTVISAYETGLRFPPYPVLLKFCRFFHVTADYLLGVSLHSDTILDLSGLNQTQRSLVWHLV